MKKYSGVLCLLFFSLVAIADTPPPGTVKAKTYSGDGNTAITATGSSLNTNLTNSSLPVTGTFWQATQPVSGTFWQATQPVSLLSLPSLAAGSALIGSVNINGTVPVSGTFWQATQPVSLLSLPSLAAGSNTIGKVDINGTVPISGTITATNSANGNTGSAVPTQATQVGGSDGTNLRALKVSSQGVLSVDGSASTQPVSGTVTANAGTGTFAVSAASLPLPTGAATAAKQPALGTAGSASADVITVQGITSMTPLKTDGSGTTQPVSGTVTANAGTGTFTVDGSGHTQPVSGTFWQTTQPVSAASLPLPSGASTSALQTTGNSSLSSIDTKTPSLGQALSAASVPVVLPAAQITTLTPLSSVTVTQATGSNLHTAVDSSALPTGASTAAKQPALGTAGTASSDVLTVQGIASMTALKVDGSAVTQPVSGTFWQATQPVSGTFFQATQPVSLTSLPSLAAGSAIIGKVGIDQTTPGTTNLVALAANQSVNVAQINGVTPLMGNGTTGTGSQRVTIASDNTAFSVNATPVVPTAVTVKQAAITIGTSAVRLTTDGSAPSSTRVLLVAQLLSTSTANCYFGSSGVTSSSTTRGVQMFAGQVFSFNKDAGDYYAICDASSQTFFITEQE